MNRIGSLWIGDELGDIELASIASFLRLGHEVTVYSYAPISNLPERAIAADAGAIFPADRIVRHWRHGNSALHSDLFRYAMIARTDQTWVDLDMIALKPFQFSSPFVFGFEDAERINGAVLALPADSKMLKFLLNFTPESRGVPPHLTGLRRMKYALRGLFRGGVPLERWPWGSIGPRALTYYAETTGEVAHALPVDAFYAVPHGEARRFLTPGDLTPGDLPETAFGVHLWGGELRRILRQDFGGVIPEGSFLARQLSISG